MFRFFIDKKIEDPSNIIITDKAIINKISKVLRKKTGDFFVLFDLDGNEYEVEIVEINNKKLICKAFKRNFSERELDVGINLYQALLKSDKFELVIQKATEIGVKKIIPIKTDYSVINQVPQNKYLRWQKIINEATMQSGGKIPPLIEELVSFNDVFSTLDTQSINLIAYENETSRHLKDILSQKNNKKINIFIGPEGGFSAEEINLAQRNSLLTFSLGNRILRSETAAIVVCGFIANYYK